MEVKEQKTPEEELADAVDKANKTALIFDRSLKFKIHDETHEMMISVIDSNTNKVVRDIPPKEFLDMIAKMKAYIGLIFDKKA